MCTLYNNSAVPFLAALFASLALQVLHVRWIDLWKAIFLSTLILTPVAVMYIIHNKSVAVCAETMAWMISFDIIFPSIREASKK